jgi:hypothetical protein
LEKEKRCFAPDTVTESISAVGESLIETLLGPEAKEIVLTPIKRCCNGFRITSISWLKIFEG